jgi:hypothetical protein
VAQFWRARHRWGLGLAGEGIAAYPGLVPAFGLGEEAADERSGGSNGGGERLRTGKASPKAMVGGERVE